MSLPSEVIPAESPRHLWSAALVVTIVSYLHKDGLPGVEVRDQLPALLLRQSAAAGEIRLAVYSERHHEVSRFCVYEALKDED